MYRGSAGASRYRLLYPEDGYSRYIRHADIRLHGVILKKSALVSMCTLSLTVNIRELSVCVIICGLSCQFYASANTATFHLRHQVTASLHARIQLPVTRSASIKCAADGEEISDCCQILQTSKA